MGKAHPDDTLIAQWRADQFRFTRERLDLRYDDTARLQQVIAAYSPIVRAEFERLDKQAK